MTDKYLSVTFLRLQLRTLRLIEDEYLSLLWRGTFYFTRSYRNAALDTFSIGIGHTVVLPVQGQVPATLLLQNWQNNMILFQHEVDVGELRSRRSARKRHEIRQGEILEFTVHVLTPGEFLLTRELIAGVSQHYLIIHQITINDTDEVVDTGPSYFQLVCGEGRVIVPVTNSVVSIPLPNWVQFQHVKNGRLRSRSRRYEWQQLCEETMSVRMLVREQKAYDMEIGCLWGINLWRNRFENSLLLDSFEILVYDLEVRFEVAKGDMADMRMKIVYGNKAFQIGGEMESPKVLRYSKIVYFIVKSEEEDFGLVLEKNGRAIARASVGAQQLISCHLNTIKKKLSNTSTNRVIASLKFKCEKAKTLSLPQNNAFWKACNREKQKEVTMLQFSQISLALGEDVRCGVAIKTEQEQVYIPDVNNFSFFRLESEVPEPVALAVREGENVYMKLVRQGEKSEEGFIGIAVVHCGELRLGINCLSLSFFRQQQKTGEANLLINKVVPSPFARPSFQPESLLGMGSKTVRLTVGIKRIELNSYYYTYSYDGKGELYCIVQINRVKKVLILERFPSALQKLLFINESGSDLLNFTTEEVEAARVRFTLLISDGGVEEEIYGTLQRKVRVQDLQEGVEFRKEVLLNDYGIDVGEIEFEVQRGKEFHGMPIKKELSSVKNEIERVNRSIEKVERRRGGEYAGMGKGGSMEKRRKMGTIVLPEIKDPRQERLKKLAKMLEMKGRPRQGKAKNSQNYTSVEGQLPEDRYKESRVKSHRVAVGREYRESEDNRVLNVATLDVMREEAGESEPPQRVSRVNVELEDNEFAFI